MEATFRSFIDHVNGRQWTEIARVISPGQVRYNGRLYDHVDFLSKMQQRIGALPDGSFDIATFVCDETAEILAARIVYRTLLAEGEQAAVEAGVKLVANAGDYSPASSPGSESRKLLTGMHHLFCWLEDGRVRRIETIGDIDGTFQDEAAALPPNSLTQTTLAESQSQTQPALAPSHTTVATVTGPASVPAPPNAPNAGAASDTVPYPRTADELRRIYTDYVSVINARAMATDLPRFCHPRVLYNHKHQYDIASYRKLMEDSQAAIEGLTFIVDAIIVDEAEQRLAVRIEFEGTPIRKWAGVEPPPPEDGAGGSIKRKSVNFAEHVFYWLSDGKIYNVLSLVDFAAYRAQMKLKDSKSGVP